MIFSLQHKEDDLKKAAKHDKGNVNFSSGLNVVHLGLHLPTGNGGFAIITRFELQGDGAWADVGDCHIGRRTRKLCEERRVSVELKKDRTIMSYGASNALTMLWDYFVWRPLPHAAFGL